MELVLFCFVLSFLTSFVLWRFPLSALLDRAGDRSLHMGVIPRSGGLAIIFALGISYTLSDVILFSPVMLMAIIALSVISLWDDVMSLPQSIRLLIQLGACSLMVFQGGLYILLFAGMPVMVAQVVTTLGLVWLINLYNFMDGMDGFAAGMAVIGFGTLACLGFLANDLAYVKLNSLIVAAALGFGIWNFPPARIFMRDCGSIVLGALAGVIALSGVQRGLFPLWVPVLVFSPFWVDATYTLLCRIKRGERFWLSHRSHLYQQLVISGLGHRRVVLGEYGLMLLCAVTVILPPLLGLNYNALMPLAWVGVYFLLILRVVAWLKGVEGRSSDRANMHNPD